MNGNAHIALIHHQFEQQVLKTPDAIAVLFQGQSLTYKELNQKANQLASYLKSLGIKSNAVIGVFVERSIEQIITVLGILKAGAAYLPLDSSYPVERLLYMIEDARAAIVISQESLLGHFPENGFQVVPIDASEEILQSYPTNNLEINITPESLGYVIYTSGSTGKPKGVEMPHKALDNLLQWQRRQIPVVPQSRTLQFTPISFDVSFQEIFSTLIDGGTIVLITDRERRDPLRLLQTLNETRIERLFLPFVALRQLAEMAVKQDSPGIFLKDVITAGEQLRITTELVQLFQKMPQCRLHNHYGPSESHVVTAYTLSGNPEEWPALPPIGSPIDNTQIHILNSELKPVPTGASGEIYIGGDCLAQGYRYRPDLTDERFITHPSGDRLYKTGDLGKYLSDNNIQYEGRGDQQVKIRGYRIEPGEIEATIEKHPNVREAVIIIREQKSGEKRNRDFGDQRLVAYIIPEHSSHNKESFDAPFSRELRDFLKQQLPDYMIPSAFIVMKEFPLTPSGKLDRRALPSPQWTRMEEGIYVAPRDAIEIQLKEIWSNLLGIDQIGIHDNFFDLGGYSLLCARLIAEISEVLQIDICLDVFFKQPTIIGLAQSIEANQQKDTRESKPHDLETEIELDSTIQVENHFSGPIPSVFLTGVTGLLGASLLYELLKDTKSDVYCLVRASHLEEGQARIKDTLKRYKLWDEDFDHRIFPVLGNLEEPFLGLDSITFSRLAEKIDVIYHSAAWVNIIYPYSVLKKANTDGTQELLRLASKTKVKPLHYISTIDVFANAEAGDIRTINVQTPAGPVHTLHSGYAQSKYMAEKLLDMAFARGIPVLTYRPSNIIGHRQTGVYDTNSFIALMIKGCVQMGVAPNMVSILNLVSSDYVSQCIMRFAQQKNLYGQAIQTVNTKPSSTWVELVQWMNQAGYEMQLVSYESWYSALLKVAAQKTDNVLAPLAGIFTNQKFIQKLLGAFNFEANESLSDLTSSVSCPTVDEKFFQEYFAGLIRSGFLNPPVQKQPTFQDERLLSTPSTNVPQ
jgi:amino acid adenylation domain-containing protein/thioester reductase-like protein